MFCGSVDWAATGAMLQGIGTIGGAIFVLIAANIGKDTFKSWKTQKIEERRLMTAESALTLAYKLQRAMGSIRNPAQFGGEMTTAENTLREQGVITDQTSAGRRQSLITAQVVLDRICHYSQLYDALDELRPTARAVFGQTIEEHLEAFAIETRKVRVAALGYARAGRENYPSEEALRRDMERHGRYEALIWEDSQISENGELAEDPVKKALNDAVDALEAAFKPYFDAESNR